MRTKEEDLELFNSILDRWKSGNYSKDWRKGQAIWNMIAMDFPDIATALDNTRFDCFFIESRTDAYIAKVKSIIEEPKRDIIVVECLSDEELLSIVTDITSQVVPEDSLARKIALQAFNSETTMDFIRVGMLILPIIAERMRNYSPHIIK